MDPLDERTIEKLKRVNLAFYERFGGDFSRTRRGAWVGWDRILDRFDRPISVLDVGCGNGRFLDALEAKGLCRTYVGVDTSHSLLEIAQARHTNATFMHADALSLEPPRSDLVVAFGLLHHLPGAENRLRLFRRFATLGHTVAVTFWRFDGLERFEKKKRPFSEIGVFEEDVEPGDFLLEWRRSAYRYCHHASDGEIETLIGASGLREVDRYVADGGLNLYVVLEDR